MVDIVLTHGDLRNLAHLDMEKTQLNRTVVDLLGLDVALENELNSKLGK